MFERGILQSLFWKMRTFNKLLTEMRSAGQDFSSPLLALAELHLKSQVQCRIYVTLFMLQSAEMS